jgi:hypothetical protein
MSSTVVKRWHPEYHGDVWQPVITGHKGFIEPFVHAAEAWAFVRGYEAAQAELEDRRTILRDLNRKLQLESVNASLREDTLQREFDIVDSACDFWKDQAIELGYNEG